LTVFVIRKWSWNLRKNEAAISQSKMSLNYCTFRIVKHTNC